MPEWCDNSVTITGPTERITKLWNDAIKAEGLLEAMVPRPKEFNVNQSTNDQDSSEEERQVEEELMEKYGVSNGYDWAVRHWGCKRDVSLDGLEFIADNGDGTASISGWFESVWSPPIAAYETFTYEMHESCFIEASYLDLNFEFAGFWSTTNGEEHLDDLRAEYEQEEENRSDLYRRLDEQYDLTHQFQDWGGGFIQEGEGDRRRRNRRRVRRRRRKVRCIKRKRNRRRRR